MSHAVLPQPTMKDVIIGPLTDHQVGHVTVRPLFGLDVEIHVHGWHTIVIGFFRVEPLHETSVGGGFHVLLAGVTLCVPALVAAYLFTIVHVQMTGGAFPSGGTYRVGPTGRLTTLGIRFVFGQAVGSIKGTITILTGQGGGLVHFVGLSKFQARVLSTTTAMDAPVLLTLMMSRLVISLETRGTEEVLDQEPLGTVEGVIVVIVVEDPNDAGTASVGHGQVGFCHQAFGCLLTTFQIPGHVRPLFAEDLVSTRQVECTGGDNGPGRTPTRHVSTDLDQGLFDLAELYV